ncbi:hypothetical protein QVZ41_13915 [Wenyingzhuangia sp. chi5]|uniref:Uncharacterized protein n=2 Tax=Wenyingzhuangia gilva TaxID=3057677 RepID=A0ABT8VVE1_9FLAO|nr:hypothetical protein [Wenyingzhuangia sp. chi5]
MDDFIPPIRERETEELLEILAFENDWDPKAVLLAKNELSNRKIDSKEIQNAKKFAKEFEQNLKSEKAEEGFTLADFIFDFGHTLFIILFSWELKKDGFPRKAKQQKYFRIGILIILFIIFIYSIFK